MFHNGLNFLTLKKGLTVDLRIHKTTEQCANKRKPKEKEYIIHSEIMIPSPSQKGALVIKLQKNHQSKEIKSKDSLYRN